ncbi:hypothetical protein DLC02_19100 [Salmonella enterica subsp. enterica serovar Chittagong]|nr:hypothetical protein [Salmonella enterica subsp. enterica serovar Chittagong]ECI2729800.1 hypothetical protein [Salmonella enterica subsp. enterica]
MSLYPGSLFFNTPHANAISFPKLILHLYSSSFKLLLRWLRSCTPVTYFSKLLGILSLAALKQLE